MRAVNEPLELGEFVTKTSADGKRSTGFVTHISDDEKALTVSVHYRLRGKLYDVLRQAYGQGTAMPEPLRRLTPDVTGDSRWDRTHAGK